MGLELIANEWDAEQVTDWGLDIPDFKIEARAQEDDYEIHDEIQTDIVLGDLFEIGPHRLICGDSTQTDIFGILFGDQFADLVVTDPPYNVAYEEQREVENINDKQTDGNTSSYMIFILH